MAEPVIFVMVFFKCFCGFFLLFFTGRSLLRETGEPGLECAQGPGRGWDAKFVCCTKTREIISNLTRKNIKFLRDLWLNMC